MKACRLSMNFYKIEIGAHILWNNALSGSWQFQLLYITNYFQVQSSEPFLAPCSNQTLRNL